MLAAFVLGRAGECCLVRFKGLGVRPVRPVLAPPAELAHHAAHRA